MNKKEIITKVMEIEFRPDLTLATYDASSVPSIPTNNVAFLGTAFKPLAEIINSTLSNGGSGMYFVNTGGKKMFASSGGYIGSLKTTAGAVGGGQARMIKVPFNPASIAASCAVMAIEHKINIIKIAQETIIDFLAYQELAKIKGNINTLNDILNNYKYNIDNEMYRNNKHILVQDIKRDSEQSLVLIDKLISKMCNEKTGLHLDKRVHMFLEESVNKLNDYELSLYQLAFSSFLEIVLLENFEKSYIDSLISNIKQHQEKYETSYNLVKEKIEYLSSTSIQNSLTKSVSKLSDGVGKIFNKTIIRKTNLDQKLINNSKKLQDLVTNRIESNVNVLSDTNSNIIDPFVKTIDLIKVIYNDDYTLVFDSSNIYLDIDPLKGMELST